MNKSALFATLAGTALLGACGAAPNVGGGVNVPTGGNATLENVNETVEQVEETAQDAQETAVASRNAANIADFYVTLNAHGDIAPALSESATFTIVGTPTISGRDAIVEATAAGWEQTPDQMFYTERILAADDIVVVQSITRGTSTQVGDEGAGMPFGTYALDVYTLDGTDIATIDVYINQMSILQQLGEAAMEREVPVPVTPTGEPQLEVLPGNEDNLTLARSIIDASASMNTALMRSTASADAVMHNHFTGDAEIPYSDYIANYEAMAEQYGDMSVEHLAGAAFGDNWVFTSFRASTTMAGRTGDRHPGARLPHRGRLGR